MAPQLRHNAKHLPQGAGVPLELWAGLECSLTRIGDTMYDQFAETGHLARLGDLDRLADLGVARLRYSLAWERICPHGDLSRADWEFTDRQMARCQALGLRVIACLVHHGNGPLGHTSLIDDAFPPKLAHFARAVAERYSWIDAWTPVNEPLTTARFAALYGVWYPHHQSEESFARVLLNQVRGTILAMRAIRQEIPSAKLIQTEDAGRTYATHHMGYQADFENTRRFLTWDLLCGYLRNDDHRMWGHLLWAGADERVLREIADEPCPPDILGIDHYLTSERFLDERRDRYPAHTYGNNGSDDYADTEAVRVLADGLRGGLGAVLTETAERYGLPLAVTEVHLGVHDEAEQSRWLADVWRTTQAAQAGGVDVRAVTAWAAFGAYDWNSLLTRRDRVYERGLFDIESPDATGAPRATLSAHLACDLARTGWVPALPELASPGWWQDERRLIYPVVEAHELATDGHDAFRIAPEPPGHGKQIWETPY